MKAWRSLLFGPLVIVTTTIFSIGLAGRHEQVT
jgi:hypothetical protein